MKISPFFSAVMFVSLLCVLVPATAKAAMWDIPVAPGESFRWVFVTSTGIDAMSNDISVYNSFVNQIAVDAVIPVAGVVGVSYLGDIEWRAIASTETTNAKDNIGISDSGIYTPEGDLVAMGTAELWDPFLDIHHIIDRTEVGLEPTDDYVWTGTGPGGSVSDSGLGGPDPFFGYWPEYDGVPWLWVWAGLGYPDEVHPLYAFSEELTVVPDPGALILAATGLLSSTLGLKRLRRKHQE